MIRIKVDGLDLRKIQRQVEDMARRAVEERKRDFERRARGIRCPVHGQYPQALSNFSDRVTFRFCCDVLRQLVQRAFH